MMRGLAIAALLTVSGAAAPPTGVEVEAPGPMGALRGEMIAGSARLSPVLIVPGSGPTDRNGNNPLGVAAAPYRLLAEALAARGVTTVRIDKRGMFASAGAIPDANAVTIADYARDVQTWAAAVRKRMGVGCAWALGHSEGALVALAAAQSSEGICGLILVAGPGRKVGEVLREQLRANPANVPLLDQAFAAIAKLEAGERVDTEGMHPALMPLFAPQVQGMVISLLSYDPADLAAKVTTPMLIIQGQRDMQVSEADARRLAAANPKAKLVLLPEVNHVLKAVASDDPKVNIAAYSDPALPIAPGVVEAIVSFIAAEEKK